MKSVRLLALSSMLLLVAGLLPRLALAQMASTSDSGPIYSVATYDPARNPAEDLKQTIREAQESHKRILVEVGGDWCSWCHAIEKYVHENKAVAYALREDYILMKVNMSDENRNEAFLSGYPDIPGFPHIFVLDSDGDLLHSQSTGDLEEGPSYNEQAFLAFLQKWAPEQQ
ncbi:MAG TPA: thioredoxin family protein [Rhodothermales bacterium]|nr:thioredoxin family protein [Rhodothermales bacterium]